ncbi:MAG TPA: 50S ribosomal protein L25 [Dehalococcoidia bacterium]|nr:50S ribosomal protein L25 [Dehalococcoidia bacterium]
MTELKLNATRRDTTGKKTRFLRRQGITPTHIFGHGIKSLALQCDTAELQHIIAMGGTTRLININIEEEKKPRSAFIREIQRDALSGQLLHVDFYQIKKTEKITADIPVILVGEAPATKSKENMIEHLLTHLGVSCLPDKIPPQIEIDLSPFEEAGQTIHVSDIVLDADVTITTDPEQPVVKISRIKVAVEKEEVAEEAEVEEIEGEAEAAEAAAEVTEATPAGETKEPEA